MHEGEVRIFLFVSNIEMYILGACHADELPYMFALNMLNISIQTHTPEYITSRRIVRLWTNFAKFG